MRKHILANVAVFALCVGAVTASIIQPTFVKSRNAKVGTTTDPEIACMATLLSHGKVELELTVKGSLLQADWVMIHLRDGTENVILSTQIEGHLSKDGKSRVYRVFIDHAAIKNSYVQIAAHTKKKRQYWVLMNSIEIPQSK